MRSKLGSDDALVPTIGIAAGVPFIAFAPEEEHRTSAPVVIIWHLLDPPRTEAAMAAAVPLAGLDAWKIYLGLPLSGSRMPAGGPDELMRLGFEDAVLNIHGPVLEQASAEFEPALAELRDRFDLAARPVGLVGGSLGSAVAALVLTERDIDVEAAVLISPVVRLRSMVDAMERRFGAPYSWSDDSRALARRIDFVARADEIVERRGEPAILLVIGEEDDVAGFREPAMELRGALIERYAVEDRAQVAIVNGMSHALSDEPGIEPEPQTVHAREVDRLAVRWLERHVMSA